MDGDKCLGLGRHAALLQLVGDDRQVFLGGLQDNGLGGIGQRVPIGAVGNVGLGIGRAERNAGKGRHGRWQGHARHYLEFQAGRRHGVNLGLDGLAVQRVAGDEADDILAIGLDQALAQLADDICGRLVQHRGRRRCGARRFAARALGFGIGAHLGVFGLGGVEKLLRNGQRGGDGIAHALHDLRIGHGDGTICQNLAGADGQQVGITWTSAHKDDLAQLGVWRGIAHKVLF